MVKKMIFISLLFIGFLYYLDKEGYIVITNKTKIKIDKEWGKIKQEGRNVVKHSMRSALIKGQELINETWEEAKNP